MALSRRQKRCTLNARKQAVDHPHLMLADSANRATPWRGL
eukprot:CAMPEP_0180661532 /NCGR_PEP_ID=MMETSP1037_2-20121125/58893_1 /TAXON_ID=632150 /ORGANISM="Azadinium spinosum, Strain 3D9" /LENGTH=39 /DNA_ID= /DNA_START= /DNA_END= /DNA_ORIENTATION=